MSDSEEKKENLVQNETTKVEKDDFEGYSGLDRFLLFALFFFIGIINHLGTILVMTGGRLLAYELDMKQYVTIYTSVATIFSVLTRLINSKLCLKVSYKTRVFIISFWMLVGYLSMFGVLTLHKTVLNDYKVLCFILSFIPCFFLGSSYAFGESAMIAYLRLFPKTLIGGWSSGTGLSGLISGGLNFASQMIDGLSLQYLYLGLCPLGFIYLLLFILTYRIYRRREEAIKRMSLGISRDVTLKSEEGHEEGKEEEKTKEEKAVEDGQTDNIDDEKKEMENMNKANQQMSCKNFMAVMNMCGQVIINLGLIYFLQFFCVNALLVRICSKIDIRFLPIGYSERHHKYRKGKFEFINLSFQVGMFVSKTLIKIVRKIQPIEVYTVSILLVNLIYFLEYYSGILGWVVFLPLGIFLGFFSGGTYAGGFYTILNSDRVKKDYKELTVNVATLFNDTGTFLSGIIGYVALNYWMNDESPFDGEEIPPEDK
jgi:MFS family permease